MVRLSDLPDIDVTHLLGKECDAFETSPWVSGPPVAERRVAIITTAGLHRRDDRSFDIRDTGPGFDDTDLPHLFDSFFRGPGQGSDRRHGGLGLAITRRIIELHQGMIAADNLPQGGASIRFEIPLHTQ